MKNAATNSTKLKTVRPGDVLTLQDDRFHVLSFQHHKGLVTLELEDNPNPPLTLIGVAGMQVSVEAGR